MVDCDDKMVLHYELAFGGTDWWTPFIDKLIIPRLVSRFVAISVIPPNEGYDMFHMLITRWKPVVSPVAPGFEDKTRYTLYVSPGSQISHIATNKVISKDNTYYITY